MVVIGASACGSSSSSSAGDATEAIDDGVVEWPRPENQHELIQNAGLPALDAEVFTIHWHAHLDIYVDQDPVLVPANLGIDEVERKISPLHTHDDSGVVHIEAPDTTPISLGQLFTLWDLRLDDKCVSTYCSPQTPIKTYVDGEQFTGNPADLVLKDHQEIAVVIGKAPRSIPKSYGDF